MPMLSSQDLEFLAIHSAAGDRVAYYSLLAERGFAYGELALGVVTNNALPGSVANEFFYS